MSEVLSTVIYFGCYLLSVVFVSLAMKYKRINRKWRKKISIFFGALIPSLLAGMRYNVGTDYSTYMHIYQVATNSSFSEYLGGALGNQLGLFVVAKVAHFFGDYHLFFFIFAFIPLYLIIQQMIDYYPEISAPTVVYIYLLGIFTTGLNIIRQGVAVGIVFYGLHFVYEHKAIRFFICIAIACLFHTAAIVAAPIFFLWNYQRNRSNTNKISIIMVFVVIALLSFGDRVVSIFSSVGFMARYITEYLSTNNGTYSNYSLYINMVIFVLVLMFRGKLIRLDSRNSLLIYLFFISVLIDFSGFINPTIKRLGLYYSVFSYPLIAQIPKLFKKHDRKYIRGMIFLYYSIVFIVTCIIMKQGNIIPYKIM